MCPLWSHNGQWQHAHPLLAPLTQSHERPSNYFHGICRKSESENDEQRTHKKNIHNYFCFSGNSHFFHLNKRSKFYSTSPWTFILFTVECTLRCCGRTWTRTQRPDRSFKGEKPVQVPLCGEPLGHVGVVPLLEHWESRDDESSRSWKRAAEAPPTDCEAQLPDGRRAELLGYTTILLFLLLLLFSLNSFHCERKWLKWGEKRKERKSCSDGLGTTELLQPLQFVCIARVGSPRNISLSFSSKQTRHISLALATINLWCRDQSRCRLVKIFSVLGDWKVSEARWGVSGWRGTRTPWWRSAASANTDLSISMVVWSVVGIPV